MKHPSLPPRIRPELTFIPPIPGGFVVALDDPAHELGRHGVGAVHSPKKDPRNS
jgi:hypothetical protein